MEGGEVHQRKTDRAHEEFFSSSQSLENESDENPAHVFEAARWDGQRCSRHSVHQGPIRSHHQSVRLKPEYLKTFILVMKYSGLATVDAIKLTPDHLEENHLKLRRTKTRGWVKVLLPPAIGERLRTLPVNPCGHWFWNKKKDSKHETATGNMRRMLRPILGPNGANIALPGQRGEPDS